MTFLYTHNYGLVDKILMTHNINNNITRKSVITFIQH